MKKVLAKGVDWTWHDGEDDQALPVLMTIQHADRDALRLLLEAGAPVDRHYKDGTSAMGEAINGAGPNGSSPYERIVEELLAHGADPNHRLPDGRTPLFAAAELGNLRILTALLDRGARVNDLVLDETALDAAERTNNITAARVIHARGGRRHGTSHE
jgi:ankyrin repeat protein